MIALLILLTLTTFEQSWIGRKVWQNECHGTVAGLTSWNEGEEFPSLGIGHFIWYPRGLRGPFVESFPSFVRFARERGATPPSVALESACPWDSKQAFEQAQESEQMVELRTWLAATVDLQTEFLVARMQASLPRLVEAAPDPERVKRNLDKLLATPNGVYALIDYVNFKGEGIAPAERYQGHGWGLLWVLLEMKDVPAGPRAAYEFSQAARRCLDRRIANSPPGRGEERWRSGWHKRCDTYALPLMVVRREEWGSVPQPLGPELEHVPNRLVVHHAGVPTKHDVDMAEKVRAMQLWGQKDKAWPDLPYHYMIAFDGRIFEGRDVRYRPESNTKYDLNGVINVELDGDFETEKVSPEQREALIQILVYLCLRHNLDPGTIRGHRDEAPGQTTCPGKDLAELVDGPLQDLVRERLRSSEAQKSGS
ncbi:MAG: hypothetical protein AMXMBFR33_47260 [Candidatus Xenobia bacterium]